MKNLLKILGWLILIIGILLIASPYFGCMGTENDFQCLVVSLMFSTSKIILGCLFLIGGIIILITKPEHRKKSVVIVSIIIVLALLFFGISPKVSYNVQRTSCDDLNKVETVMTEGTQIIADTGGKTLNISAGPCYERTYTWENGTCTILQHARKSRWYGSLGIYSPSAMDWKSGSCKELNHAVVEEGQQQFSDVSDALAWLQGKYNNWQSLPESQWRPGVYLSQSAYTNDGLLVSWELSPLEDKKFLNVSVWQIYINGVKPTKLEGAQDDKIRVITP